MVASLWFVALTVAANPVHAGPPDPAIDEPIPPASAADDDGTVQVDPDPAGDDPASDDSAADDGAPSDDTQPVGDSDEQAWPLEREPRDVELTGIAPSAEFEFTVPPGWTPSGDGRVVLDYSLPSLADSAAIGVAFNGDLVDAVGLSPGSGSVAVALPATDLRTGTNRVMVTATIALLDDRECPDPYNPGRTLTIADSSRLVMPLVPGSLSLADGADALEPLGVAGQDLTVRLAAAPTDQELTAAAQVLAGVDREAEFRLVVDDLESHGSADAPDLIVGTSSELADAGIPVPNEPGGFLQITFHDGGHPRLVVGGSTPDEVLAAARALRDGGDASLVVGITELSEPVVPPQRTRFELGELGYPDRELTGPGVDSTVYGFDIPLSHSPTSMAITIDAVRSASGEELNGLSVILNGARVGTVHFDVDTGATSGIELEVAGDDVRPGRNTLKLEAEFAGPPVDCDERPPAALVEISASTTIELFTDNESVSVDLEDLPYLFRSPQDSVDLDVVLPVDPTRQDLMDAIALAVDYGDEEFAAGVVHAESVGQGDLDGRHFIALGEPEMQPLHDLVRDTIVDGEAADESDAASFADPGNLNGVIEIVPNPIDRTRAIMFATGFDAAGADLAQQVLLDPSSRGELFGRATFVGGDPSDPNSAPVLEPVRIDRGELAIDPEQGNRFETTTSTDDAIEIDTTVGDDVVFDVAPDDDRSTVGSVPLTLVGIIGAGALTAGGGYVAIRRRKSSESDS